MQRARPNQGLAPNQKADPPQRLTPNQGGGRPGGRARARPRAGRAPGWQGRQGKGQETARPDQGLAPNQKADPPLGLPPDQRGQPGKTGSVPAGPRLSGDILFDWLAKGQNVIVITELRLNRDDMLDWAVKHKITNGQLGREQFLAFWKDRLQADPRKDGGDSDRRLRDLERRLDEVVRQLERLRQDMQRGRPDQRRAPNR